MGIDGLRTFLINMGIARLPTLADFASKDGKKKRILVDGSCLSASMFSFHWDILFVGLLLLTASCAQHWWAIASPAGSASCVRRAMGCRLSERYDPRLAEFAYSFVSDWFGVIFSMYL
jgi:hypothetical protein